MRKLYAFIQDDRLQIQAKPYVDDGWIIRLDEAKPTGKWEVLEVPLCGETRFCVACDSFAEALSKAEEMT